MENVSLKQSENPEFPISKQNSTSRSQRLIANTFWSFTTRCSPIVLHFFTTPYVVSQLGVDAYAVYAMIFVVLGYFGFLNLGLSKAVIKFVAEAIGRSDRETARQLVVTALGLYVVLGLIGASLLFALSEWIISSVLQIPVELQADALIAFRVSAAIFLLNIPTQALVAVPKASERFDISGRFEMGMVASQTLSSVAVLAAGGGLKEVAIALGAVTIVGSTVAAIIAVRLLPLRPILSGFRTESLKRILQFGGVVTAEGVLIVFAARINSLIIGIFQPIGTFAYYSVAEGIASRVSSLPQSVNETILPSFSRLDGERRPDLLSSLFLRATRYVVLITIPFFFLFLVFPDKFLGFWLGPDFASEGANVLRVLGTGYLVSFWGYPTIAVARGMNRPGVSIRWQAIIGVINVSLCFLLIPPFGILGAAFAWSIHRFGIIPLFIHSIGKELLGIYAARLWRESFLKPLLVGIVFLSGAVGCRPMIGSLVELIGVLGVLTALYLVVCYWVALDNTDRIEAQRFVRKSRLWTLIHARYARWNS